MFKSFVKISFLLLFCSSSAFAIKFHNSIHSVYEVSFGIFGKLGECNVTTKRLANNKYEIRVVAHATGFANTLSDGMVERYVSKGYIKSKVFVPTSYYRKTTTNKSVKEYLYVFDYDKKNVTKNYKETIHEKVYTEDDDGFSYYEDKTTTTTDKEHLDFWATEDVLSMFMNADIYINTYKQDKVHNITAVGASEDQHGIIELLIPSKQARVKLLDGVETKKDEIFMVIKIHKDIFNDDDGDLILSFSKDGVFHSALLQNVLIFGDIKGELTSTISK